MAAMSSGAWLRLDEQGQEAGRLPVIRWPLVDGSHMTKAGRAHFGDHAMHLRDEIRHRDVDEARRRKREKMWHQHRMSAPSMKLCTESPIRTKLRSMSLTAMSCVK